MAAATTLFHLGGTWTDIGLGPLQVQVADLAKAVSLTVADAQPDPSFRGSFVEGVDGPVSFLTSARVWALALSNGSASITDIAVSPTIVPGGAAALAKASLDSTGKVLTGSGVAAGTTVTVYVNGTAAGTTVANAVGAWSYTFKTAPAAGASITYAAVTVAATIVPPSSSTPASTSHFTMEGGTDAFLMEDGSSYLLQEAA